MTLMKHEIRQGGKALAVWTASIGFLIAVCVFMFPEMKGEMEGVTDMFASMGAFSAAFGMDRINFGTLTGFYAVECGNILGLGGAFFAAMIAAASLSKEEKERTAEFLLTHPVRRTWIVTQKLAAVMIQIAAMNAVVFALSAGSIALIGEEIRWKELALLHAAYWLMQVELAGICFGLSAFMRRGGMGVGLGLAAVMYFLNIIANISDGASFLKAVTPFAYTEGADILRSGRLDGGLILLGMIYAAVGIAAAYGQYARKDIH